MTEEVPPPSEPSQPLLSKNGRKLDGRQNNGSKKGERRGGRQKGTPNTRTRQLAMNAIQKAAEGVSPVEVMLGNMRFWTAQTIKMTEDLKKLVVSATNEDERKEAFSLLKQMLACRENAERCAVDAAPYCHPRLANISYKDPSIDIDELEQEPADAIAAAETYARLIAS